jgi:ferric-dicitrate binding protein FerR (iron transport regulator)
VVTAYGSVSVIRDGSPWALFEGKTVQTGETIVTEEDGYAELRLSDGSQFVVYPGSQVVFRKNVGSLRDLLDVFFGRVKMHLQKLGSEPRYRIFTPTAVISVRGTIFDVAVEQDETTMVWVDEGLVGVSHRLLPGEREIAVGAGQSLVIYRDVPLAQAGMDKVKVMRAAGDVLRTAAYIWSRAGSGGGASGGGVPGGGPGGGLPGDEPAPEPPPPPPGP